MIMVRRPNMVVTVSSIDSVALSYVGDDTLLASVTTESGVNRDVHMTSKEARAFITSLFESGFISTKEFYALSEVIETAQDALKR